MPLLLIVNADDFGYDPQVTRGIAEAMRQGVVSSTTFMVNTPFSEAAAAQAAGLAVGLHLNLARHAPVDPRFPAVFLDRGQLVEMRAGSLPAEVVEKETLAQLDRLQALLGRPATHIDVHKHLHRHPLVLDGLASAARARRVPVRSIDEGMRELLRERGVVTNDGFLGDAGAEPYWTLSRLRAEVERLPDEGVVELMCHPGYTPSEVRSGYSTQREVELTTFLHPGARSLLLRRRVELGNWGHLAARHAPRR